MKIKVINDGVTKLEPKEGTLWINPSDQDYPDDEDPIYLLIHDTEHGYKSHDIKTCNNVWSSFREHPRNAIEGLVPFTGTLEISNG